MNKQKVYRSGLMTPAVDAGAAASVTCEADARCPHPTRRHGALFAAPTFDGVTRWVLGNDMCGYNTRVREITVDADTTWVYRVHTWEYVRDNNTDSMDAYWATGMTLTDWLAAAEVQGLDGSEWEVLINPENVISHRNVSVNRLMNVAPQWRIPELKRVVRKWQWQS